MTTRVTQTAPQFLVQTAATPRVAQSAIQFLVQNFSTAAPTQVAQSAIQFLIRPYPVEKILEVFPSQETYQSALPKKRVDLL